MKIIHRISLTPSEAQRALLVSMGLHLIESDSPLVRLVSFDIEESDDCWPKVEELIQEWNPADFSRTYFSKREIEDASFLQMSSTLKGYPQPDGDFGYLKATYDLSNYCQDCGIGLTQSSPFRIKGEPKWGKKHIFQLNWVFDEFFVLPDTWESTFEPIGVGYRPVIDHRTDKELQTVLQLDISTTVSSPLQLAKDQPSEFCTRCGRKKYLPISRGPFPLLEKVPTGHIQKTKECFGSGVSAWNAIIISSNLFQQIKKHKMMGAEFIPCDQPVSTDEIEL